MTSDNSMMEAIKRNNELRREAGVEPDPSLKAVAAPGKAVSSVLGPVADGLGEIWAWGKGKVAGTFSDSANFDTKAQEAYKNRDAIISSFAAGYRANSISPETMQGMEYLKDKKMLTETSSGRISEGLYDYVKENPSNFGLKVEAVKTYDGGKQDLTLYGSMKA